MQPNRPTPTHRLKPTRDPGATNRDEVTLRSRWTLHQERGVSTQFAVSGCRTKKGNGQLVSPMAGWWWPANANTCTQPLSAGRCERHHGRLRNPGISGHGIGPKKRKEETSWLRRYERLLDWCRTGAAPGRSRKGCEGYSVLAPAIAHHVPIRAVLVALRKSSV